MKEDSKVYSTGTASEDFSGAVVYARYNITEDMSKTGLFSTSNVKALKVDGEVMEFEPEVEMSGELTVLGENVTLDMENEILTVPDEYMFDNSKLRSLVVRPTNGDISVYNAVCFGFMIGGVNRPIPLRFDEAEHMGVVIDYENNLIDLFPMLEILSMHFPGNTSVCMVNTETFVFGDTLVSFSGITGGMPVVIDFESAGEHELEVQLKDDESIGLMFANNIGVDYGLVEVVIPETVKYLDEYCFTYDNNLSKVTIPESVESIGAYCFDNCYHLTDVCILGEGVKSIGGYAFNHCESLTAITLPDSIDTIEYSVFYECKQLKSVKLPNGISALNRATFYGCVALDIVVIPDSVTVISNNCFYGCSGITSITIPEGLTEIEYSAFSGCVGLKEIHVLPFTALTITDSVFKGVSATGVLYYPYGSDYSSWKKGGLLNWEFVADFTPTECTSLTITANNVKSHETTTTIHYTATVNGVDYLGNTVTGVVISGTSVSEEFEENQSDETIERVVTFEFIGVTATTVITQSGYTKPLWFTPINNCQFTFTKNGDGDDICYSIDNAATWVVLPSGESTPQIQAGERIFWKSSITPSNNIGIGCFSSTGDFNAHGNVMSLLYSDDYNRQTSLEGKDYAFKNLFKNCDYLIDISNLILPATTLSKYCYEYMFSDCTSLTAAPELPATKLNTACYSGMFYGCTSLTAAPELPATKLVYGCYQMMFSHCRNLTTAPELPATTLESRCYQFMFSACESLTTAPELPATTLANECYHDMFSFCTSLTTAPQLPATTLAEGCYIQMFKNCTNLNHITMLATGISATDCLTDWVYNVSSTGTFVKHPDMTSLSRGIHGIPEGWTVEDYQG